MCVCEYFHVCVCVCVLHVCALHSLWPHKTVIWRHLHVVKLLIQRGADINIRRKVRIFTEGLCMCVCL